MGKSDFFRVLSVLSFAGAYHFVYVKYLNPLFDYAHYRIESRGLFEWVLIYAILIVPGIWQRSRNSAVGAGISLMYLLLYVPAIITMGMMWRMSDFSFFSVSLSMLLGQIIIQGVISRRQRLIFESSSGEGVLRVGGHLSLIGFSIVSVFVFIADNYMHMQLVGFDDVYDIRFAANDSGGLLSGYLSMWLLGVSLPYILAVAFLRKSVLWCICGVGLSVLIYMGNGAKSALLMPVQVFLMGFIVSRDVDSTRRLATILTIVVVVLLFADDDYFRLVKSLIFMRLFSVGGWTITNYYEFFSENGYTYYTHISIVGGLLGKVYNLQPGRLIGLEYSESEEANFNANFWATDGVAAIGVLGIILVSVLVRVVLKGIIVVVRDKDQRAVSIFLTGIWLSLLNGSLFTTMLSGGGIIVYILLSHSGGFGQKSPKVNG